MSRMSRRSQRGWCPASPLATRPRGPWREDDRRRGREERSKMEMREKEMDEVKVARAERQLSRLFVWFSTS